MSISRFIRNNFSGYLSNRYQITIPALFANVMKFEAIILQVPGSEIANSSIGFWGRAVNIPRTRSFLPLIMTVYDGIPEKALFERTKIEEWMNRIDRTALDQKPERSKDEYQYTDDIIIEYSQSSGSAYNSPVFQNKLILKSAWPSFIGPLQLSNESSDWARYELQITYDYYYYP